MKNREITKTALEAVKIASKACRHIRERTPGTTQKEDRTPVTAADFTSQIIIIDRLLKKFPETAIIAEEDLSALKREELLPVLKIVRDTVSIFAPGTDFEGIIRTFSARNSAEAWIIDPIDGTRGFISGEHYSIAVAYKQNNVVTDAVLECPTWRGGCTLYASAGEGTFCIQQNGTHRLSITGTSRRYTQSPSKSRSDFSLHAGIAGHCGLSEGVLTLDSQLKYAAVALGDAAAYYRIPVPGTGVREKIWDHAAGFLIVQEAGGTVSYSSGCTPEFTHETFPADCGIIAASKEYHSCSIDYLNSIRT